VHKYICQGTLEEKIDLLIERKKDLADKVVGTRDTWLTELSDDELRKLFTLERDAVENE
jgi:SNF2 family DNA or RNA helicase